MNPSFPPGTPHDAPASLPEPGGRPGVAAQWLSRFARTVRTCRLYAPGNPAAVRFRDELAEATLRLLGEQAEMRFEFGPGEVRCDGVVVEEAALAEGGALQAFHRDGVRSLVLRTGLERAEIDALLDAVLAVSGPAPDEEGDLVTRLWEAGLRHAEVEVVPAAGDGDAAAAEGGDDGVPPWPDGDAEDAGSARTEPAPARSEDWALGGLTLEAEAAWAELESLAPGETARFRAEYAAEHRVSPEAAAVAIARACLAAGAGAAGHREMEAFLARVLGGALDAGAWREARAALATLRALPDAAMPPEPGAEWLAPMAVARTAEHLDAQAPESLGAFVALAHDLGDAGIDWLALALCESRTRQTRSILAEALAGRCSGHPERLAPWVADPRWYVARNIVHVLGWIGGPAVAGLLQAALGHSDERVRGEVVASLAQVELRLARPLLLQALDGVDTPRFCQALARLSGERDAVAASRLLALLRADAFAARPAEERRAVYAALASTGDDAIVPELEAELLRANWGDRALEVHRHSVARCIARIGGPAARTALARAAASRRNDVRAAAEAALAARREAA